MKNTVTWSSYLAQGTPKVVYHMCDKAMFELSTKDGSLYFPPTYKADGFVHASANPPDLIRIGNNFYKSDKGDWICFSLNPSLLNAEIKYEIAAPVGNISSLDTSGQPKFPHIYGGIPPKSVMKVYPIVRGEDGSFVSIQGLC